MGEFFLEDLLAQILPPQHFSTQHAFRSGDKVDAVIRLGASLVPVDAKFPLENFKRIIGSGQRRGQEPGEEAVRRRCEEAYRRDRRQSIFFPTRAPMISPSCIFPAENVYYETIINDEAPEEKGLSITR